MPLIKDEQEIKRKSQFLKYEAGESGNELILKSHLYQIDKHFLNSVSRSVICKGAQECLYCQANYRQQSEYNYMVYLNGEIGYIDVKASVFFAIQQIARAQKRDPRQISWTVIKKGDGLATEYTTSKDDNLTKEDFEQAQDQLKENTDKLVEVMDRHEQDLNDNYIQFMKDIREQKTPKATGESSIKYAARGKDSEEGQVVEDKPNNEEEPEVSPDQIPF